LVLEPNMGLDLPPYTDHVTYFGSIKDDGAHSMT